MTVAGVVLAAGGGRRFGGPKALVEFGGSTLVQRCAETLAAGGCGPVLAVVGAEAPRVIRSARVATQCVAINPDWEQGLSSSLRIGLRMTWSTDVGATVVALADQPLVSAVAVERLIAAWAAGAQAAVSTYGGAARNPVIFDRSVWGEVAEAAAGDEGARGWLRRSPAVVRVACDDAGAPDDVDTPQDLARLRRLANVE